MSRFVGWLAAECDGQGAGRPARAFTATAVPPTVPCALLRTAADMVPSSSLHALRHRGLTSRQVNRLRASHVVAVLAARPGATLEQLAFGTRIGRIELLEELGTLIELGAVLGINRSWYSYDIGVAALQNLPVARTGCDCPSTRSTQLCHTPRARERRWPRRSVTVLD